MAISITWDQVPEAQVEQSLLSGFRIVRVGIVKGITSDVTTSKAALLDALSASGCEQATALHRRTCGRAFWR